MANIMEKLEENIARHLDEMATCEIGSKESKAVIDDTTELYKLYIEESRTLSAVVSDLKKVDIEERKLDIEERKLAAEKKNKIIDTAIKTAEIVLPLTAYGILSYIGFAREFDGCVTSDTLKRVINSIKKK